MTMPDLHDDEELMAVLRTALDDADPVPADAVTAAVAAFDLGRADAHLADLLFDSLLDDALVTVRSAEVGDRTVTYTVGARRLSVELSAAARTLLGHLDPPAPAEVTLMTAGGSTSARTDDLGRFHLPLRPGSLRLRLALDDGTFVTPWLTR
jgi:hypothetical protein